MSSTRDHEDLLDPRLSATVHELTEWWNKERAAQDISEKVHAPLYHYSDAGGLTGILRNEEIWFTSIFHMNDPSELSYGIEMALAVLQAEAEAGDRVVRFFCDRIRSALVNQVGSAFGFYLASFSRDSDDLGQWRAYGDDGRGFSVGFAPYLFHPEEKTNQKPPEIVFVAPVNYKPDEAKARQEFAIKRAVGLIKREQASIKSEDQGRLFLKDLSIALAIPILWYAITTKHPAYTNEAETRLIIVNAIESLAPYIETRSRASELIPFIRSPMPTKTKGNVTEITVGPAADLMAEDAVRALLYSLQLEQVPIRRSTIPYRGR